MHFANANVTMDEARRIADQHCEAAKPTRKGLTEKTHYGGALHHCGFEWSLQTELQTNHAAQDGIRHHKAT
jgi:hypothetical protein